MSLLIFPGVHAWEGRSWEGIAIVDRSDVEL